MKRDYSKYDFKSVVKLDASSESGLIWISPRIRSGKPIFDRVGKQAGLAKHVKDRQSYFVFGAFGEQFFAHRVVYLLKHGELNTYLDVDHIDGNGLNNTINNLRLVSPCINSRNRRKNKGSTNLYMGVFLEDYFSRAGTPLRRIRALVTPQRNKTRTKSYAVLKYGYDKALELALAWRAERLKELCEQGFGYTERHGT